MSKTIDTERYCWAMEAWASMPRDSKGACDEETVRDTCSYLRENMPGVHEVSSLCEAARLRIEDRHLLTDIAKSCLLYRLIYADERLRSVPCPVHKGMWSGWSFEPCACSFGPNLTGWLPL